MALTLADAEKVVYTSLRFRKQVFCDAKPIFPAFGLTMEMVESGKIRPDLYGAAELLLEP